jgi:hypothetical protein
MNIVATFSRVALAATVWLMIVSPVQAQTAAPPAAPSDAAVQVGALIFAGVGPSKFNNSSSVSGERLRRVSDLGGGMTLGFGGSPVGASVTLRAGFGSGPHLNTSSTQPPPGVPHADSDFAHFRAVAVSIGAPINMGRSFFVEPMLDLNSWTIRDTTTLTLNTVSSTSTVERSGSDPGFGVRGAWFPSRRVGVGAEFHYVLLHDAAPALAIPSGPGGWLEHSQAVISVYFRWKR